MLSPEVTDVSVMPGSWWVVHTKSRCEKAVAGDLLVKNIGYFLPLVKRIKVSGGRKRHFILPLFSSYVFLNGSEDDCYRARSRHICQMIRVVDQITLMRELIAIDTALRSETPIEFYPRPACGQRCRIISGSLKGIEGVVVSQNGRSRIVLEVSILGQGAMLEIDADLLEVCA